MQWGATTNQVCWLQSEVSRVMTMRCRQTPAISRKSIKGRGRKEVVTQTEAVCICISTQRVYLLFASCVSR